MSSNLSFSNSTAKRYALALYELSKENSELKNIEEEVKNLRNLLVSSVDFRKMIMNPIMAPGKSESLLGFLSLNSSYLTPNSTIRKKVATIKPGIGTSNTWGYGGNCQLEIAPTCPHNGVTYSKKSNSKFYKNGAGS